MPNGVRCESPALTERPYCYHHDRLHLVFSEPKPSKKKTLALHPLEDRESILMALSDVICGLAAGRIDSRNGGRLIYGLQVAGQFAPLVTRSAADDAVESVVLTETGDEIAPERIDCSEKDDCESCIFLDECDSGKSRVSHAAEDDEDENEEEEDDSDEEDEDDDSADSGGENAA